jgi:hypothetical protein
MLLLGPKSGVTDSLIKEMTMTSQGRKKSLATIIVLYFFFSIPAYASPPDPVTTKYLRTTAAGFNIDRSSGTIYYTLNCQIRSNLTSPVYVAIRFQNPDSKGAPFIQYAILEPSQKEFTVESPAFKRIKNNRNYEVLITLFKDAERKNIIASHSQRVHFSVPERLIPNLGIEVTQ